MAAQVVPFAIPERRRVRLVATPTQRQAWEKFISAVQLIMLERPNAFVWLDEQAQEFAAPIRKRLADIS